MQPLLARLLAASQAHPDRFAETPLTHLLTTSAKIECFWQTLHPKPTNITARKLIDGAGVTPRRLNTILGFMGWQAKQITRTNAAGKVTKRMVYAPPREDGGQLPPDLTGKLKSPRKRSQA
jgi:hypothetical protein